MSSIPTPGWLGVDHTIAPTLWRGASVDWRFQPTGSWSHPRQRLWNQSCLKVFLWSRISEDLGRTPGRVCGLCPPPTAYTGSYSDVGCCTWHLLQVSPHVLNQPHDCWVSFNVDTCDIYSPHCKWLGGHDMCCNTKFSTYCVVWCTILVPVCPRIQNRWKVCVQ